MFPSIYYIDSNGDMWVPCCCGNGPSGPAETGVETISEAGSQKITTPAEE